LCDFEPTAAAVAKEGGRGVTGGSGGSRAAVMRLRKREIEWAAGAKRGGKSIRPSGLAAAAAAQRRARRAKAAAAMRA